MARPKSPEKREALLESAVRVIAEDGLAASTAKIAKGADLAEGTMFRYFSSKDQLFNELYVELKAEVYGRLDAEFPHEASLRERARHIWMEYLQWAMERPERRKVSTLLNLSTTITATTRKQLIAKRGAVSTTMDEVGECGAFKDLPPGFAISAMTAMQEAVMETAAKKPRQKTLLAEHGFEAFWRMVE